MGDDDCGNGPGWSVSDDTSDDDIEGAADLAPSIPPARVFDILADPRRRAALGHIRDVPEQVVELSDLVTCLAESESDGDEDLAERRRRIMIDFHHNHLPKLVECGVIDYDERHETIRYVPARRVERALKHLLD